MVISILLHLVLRIFAPDTDFYYFFSDKRKKNIKSTNILDFVISWTKNLFGGIQ
jgi:hypothetical protein